MSKALEAADLAILEQLTGGLRFDRAHDYWLNPQNEQAARNLVANIRRAAISAYLRAVAEDSATMRAAVEAGVVADDKQTGYERVRTILFAALRELEPKE